MSRRQVNEIVCCRALDYNGVYRLHSAHTHGQVLAQWFLFHRSNHAWRARRSGGSVRGEHPSFLCARHSLYIWALLHKSVYELSTNLSKDDLIKQCSGTLIAPSSLFVSDLLLPFVFQTVCLRNKCAHRLHPGTRPQISFPFLLRRKNNNSILVQRLCRLK